MHVDGIRQVFRETFGHDPDVIGIAPGRINLIGEHTDYNDGFVFPAAIDRGLMIAASATEPQTETFSVQLGAGLPFAVGKVQPGFTAGWAKYAAGMGWAISDCADQQLPNLKAVVDSTIPIGSGVSSSAALEMAFGVVWSFLGKLALDNRELARLGQICENQFVGVNSGMMDQMASALGKAGHAMFLDTRTREIEYAPIPDGISVVLCDTKKERALTNSAYNERRSQCELAAQYLGVKKLRDANIAMLEDATPYFSNVIYRRAKHVITENDRCVAFKEALDAGDETSLGTLMRASHESLRHDYEVSCDELDVMAESAWAAPGCVGARMTGAGFGGACVALVKTEGLDEFASSTLELYKLATGIDGEVVPCAIADGARLLEA